MYTLPAFVHFLKALSSCLFCIFSQFSIYLLHTLLSVCSIISEMRYSYCLNYRVYFIIYRDQLSDSGFICPSRFQGSYVADNPISLIRPIKAINFQSVSLLLIVRTGVMTSKLLYEGQNQKFLLFLRFLFRLSSLIHDVLSYSQLDCLIHS